MGSSEGKGVRAAGAMIDAWRERGDHRFDPVRFRFIEVLAGRAEAHSGEARRVLDDKVHKLLAAYGEDLESARCADGDAAAQPGQAQRGALAALVDHVARHASSSRGDGTALDSKTLDYFRSTWSRLSADRRLTQSQALVPENAGPLNSHRLVHRSLTVMRELSPEYLHRFMSYVDTLLWVDQANGGGASAGTDSPRAEGHRKSARRKSG
ncbi:DUF2894 domain-containing protein [Variovorax sp. MHTC-1]|uniref:DUF2894 domain-containing protein n=1 Tax=Variovorax sp. MHTC-1 TaxID=2495593 RepID=UPI0028B22185|nr:DUF2894 domain-containing protein [Variovorax sp. MHTC-1]